MDYYLEATYRDLRLDSRRSSVRIVSQNSGHDSNRAMARSNAMQWGLQLIYTF
jgi:hypothetical protein